MNGSKVVNIVEVFFTWITRIVYLNVLWILFTLMGLVVAGLFPATMATISVARKWMLGDRDFSVLKTFKGFYSGSFLVSNVAGWIVASVGALLYLNYTVLVSLGDEVFFLVPFSFYLIVFLFSVMAVWVFPLYSHYEGGLKQHLKNALIIGIGKLHYTLSIWVLLFFIVYISLELPGIIPFFMFSMIGVCWTWITMTVLKKLDERESSEVQGPGPAQFREQSQ
ncbi:MULTISPECIES: YesL family protein [Bacillaceae]|uniref:YesL family protein n=1 Tax=Evansella alkalicola TaxID=745819 RepID=A0ABS6K063_9BACI|nr:MULTISPECIES: YesL family protein [Bacillaceae]MBU9723832.1 YesL family protein [Bacillus alkalicola]